MNDKEFLQWIYYRLKTRHGENTDFDYMNKLQCIINSYEEGKVTPNVSGAYVATTVKRFSETQARHPDINDFVLAGEE